MNENWRAVPGWEGLYEVSDQGRVRSLDRVSVDSKGRRRPFKGRELSCKLNGRPPYKMAHLKRPGLKRSVRVHVLVMEAFEGPRPAGLRDIRHLNGNRSDCRFTNLAYGTRSQNCLDTIAHGANPRVNKTECSHGHEYTPENTYVWRSRRICRICYRRRRRQMRRRQREALSA